MWKCTKSVTGTIITDDNGEKIFSTNNGLFSNRRRFEMKNMYFEIKNI